MYVYAYTYATSITTDSISGIVIMSIYEYYFIVFYSYFIPFLAYLKSPFFFIKL